MSQKRRLAGGSGFPSRRCTCKRKEGTPHPDADTKAGSRDSSSAAAPLAVGGACGGVGDVGGAGSDGDRVERWRPRSPGRHPAGSSLSIARRCLANPLVKALSFSIGDTF